MNRSLHQPFLAGEAGMGLSAYIAAQQFSALIGIHGTASVDLWNLKAEVRAHRDMSFCHCHRSQIACSLTFFEALKTTTSVRKT